jgi:hypothetical protein
MCKDILKIKDDSFVLHVKKSMKINLIYIYIYKFTYHLQYLETFGAVTKKGEEGSVCTSSKEWTSSQQKCPQNMTEKQEQ